MKKAVVLGGGGFIGGHLAKRLKQEGFWVRVVDIIRIKMNPLDPCFNMILSCPIDIINNTIKEPNQLLSDHPFCCFIIVDEEQVRVYVIQLHILIQVVKLMYYSIKKCMFVIISYLKHNPDFI